MSWTVPSSPEVPARSCRLPLLRPANSPSEPMEVDRSGHRMQARHAHSTQTLRQVVHMTQPYRSATIKDVAARAGCSVTTVSHVLNEVPGTRIKESTREKVRA